MEKHSKIYVAGHTGMVGSAIVRKLIEDGYDNIIGKTLDELDLTNQRAVADFFSLEKPEYVFLAAAKVGGIMANNIYRAQFIYENLMIQSNVIHQSYLNGVRKLLFLGSSCIYPKNAPQPLKEEYLLTGELEPTNEPYAIAKIAGIKMCENYYRQYGCNFISVMPTNLYGPNDNYNLETSHVLPALIRKLHLGKCLENNDWISLRKDLQKRPIEGIKGDASEDQILSILSKYSIKYDSRPTSHVTITLWGTGQVYREFMHVDDMADSGIHMLLNLDAETLYQKLKRTHVNIGTGKDITITELAGIIANITGFTGNINWDSEKPDGTPKKLLNIDLLQQLDWSPQTELEQGIKLTYDGYKFMLDK
jgi:GDP-L-fucose synthase